MAAGLPSRVGLDFEWDADKAAANEAKHGVTFEEASTVFADPLSFSVADPRHSQGEPRFAILGQSARGWLLVVVHTNRGARTRLLSARSATAEAVNSALRALAEVARRQAGRAAAYEQAG